MQWQAKAGADMMSSGLLLLSLTAAAVGVVHTILGPDHYLPFALAARANGWSKRKTLTLTLVSGSGHILGSLVLGGIGIALGLAITSIEAVDGFRGVAAAWLLLGLGIWYAARGLRQAVRRRSHKHWHAHADGTVHDHHHDHQDSHLHAHGQLSTASSWALFVVFLLGPCETLFPLLVVPTAQADWFAGSVIVATFAVATLGTMVLMVWGCQSGLERIQLGRWEQHAQTITGVLIVLSAAGILVLGL
jgi:sulfite exporter TauE/SafE